MNFIYTAIDHIIWAVWFPRVPAWADPCIDRSAGHVQYGWTGGLDVGAVC